MTICIRSMHTILLKVPNLEGLKRVVSLINGYMRSPKIGALYQLIDCLNRQDPTANLPKQPLDTSPVESNAWLAGFLDSDGCFAIRTTEKGQTTPRRVSCSCEIEQREIEPSLNSGNIFVMQHIATFFLTTERVKVKKGCLNLSGEDCQRS
jgi:hypothetical protein